VLATAIYAFNLLAFAFLLWRGRCADRIAVAAFALAIVAEPLVGALTVGSWRAGTSGLNLVLFVIVWWLAERADRWWLVFVASAQFVIVATHAMPLLSENAILWSGIALRNGLYVLISLLFLVGAFEAWADRRIRTGAR
jgi:hypothetical protein